jgi:hypothetical protein
MVIPGLPWAQAQTEDLESRLGLTDLPAEHAALSGKATIDGPHASDPLRPVSFRDLWDHPKTWRGRRVQIQGSTVRIFRQGPVGSFPALAEVWLRSSEGDLLCVVFPQPGPTEDLTGARPQAVVPETGQHVTFTGTFLKTIRYPAADQPRLAPLIVGNRPPIPILETEAAPAAVDSRSRPGPTFESWSPAAWVFVLALGLVAAALLAWQQFRNPVRGKSFPTRDKNREPAAADPPLEFIDPELQRVTAQHNAERI